MRYGFHSIPSLNRLHMHLVSNDFASPFMHTKQHYLSFNSNFFLPPSEVIAMLERDGIVNINREEKQQMLKGSLRCNLCDETFDKWSKLKAHREKEHAEIVYLRQPPNDSC